MKKDNVMRTKNRMIFKFQIWFSLSLIGSAIFMGCILMGDVIDSTFALIMFVYSSFRVMGIFDEALEYRE